MTFRRERAAGGILAAVAALAGLYGCAASPPAVAGPAQVLLTPGYRVTIDVRCAEGSVTCDDVHYTGARRNGGEPVSLVGSTHHARCADGVTPCRFLGYVFRSGTVTYFVGENGWLRVTDGKTVIVDEQGAWQ